MEYHDISKNSSEVSMLGYSAIAKGEMSLLVHESGRICVPIRVQLLGLDDHKY